MKKYILGAILSLGLLVSPAFTQAAGLTTAQVNAIISLLQSFGADQSVINNVQASLTGGTTTPGGFCHNFNTNLTVGSSGAEVFALNQALGLSGVANGVTTAGKYGYFDEGTAADVVRFQAKYGISQTGYVGPLTRAKLNSLYGCGIPVPSTCPQWTPPAPDFCLNGTIVKGGTDANGCSLPGTCVIPTSPTISYLSPTSGPVGTSVRISGTGFATSNSIYLNGAFIESQSNSSGLIPTALIFTIPSSFPQICHGSDGCPGGNMTFVGTGTYNFRVVNANGTSNSVPFTVTSGTPTPICPTYTQPYCPNGTIVSGGVDVRGCSLPGTCISSLQ